MYDIFCENIEQYLSITLFQFYTSYQIFQIIYVLNNIFAHHILSNHIFANQRQTQLLVGRVANGFKVLQWIAARRPHAQLCSN